MMPKVGFEQDGDVGIITISDLPLNLWHREHKTVQPAFDLRRSAGASSERAHR